MFSSELIQNGHIKRLTITRHGAGWEVCEEHDSHVVRTIRFSDWHRVERAKETFARQNGIPAHPSVNL
jgi:hypothetical protein